VSRAEFRLAELQKEYEARVAEVTQEARDAADPAAVAEEAAAIAHDALLPEAERGATLAERAYALGDTQVLSLLEAQRVLIGARRIEIEARLEAALARIALERTLGAPLEAEARPVR
jgi:outer membrane protein TolC